MPSSGSPDQNDPSDAVTLRPRRWKTLLWLGVSLAFVAIGVWMVRDGTAIGWLPLSFFGLCALVFAILLLPNAAWLRLDRDDFTVCSLFRAQTTRWHDVDQFTVGSTAAGRNVVFNYTPASDRLHGARSIAQGLTGYEGALPDTYGMNAEALAALLHTWKGRAEEAK